ncbi:MAG TPA: hypothetical protein PLV22_04970 [Candidatus Cloacimonadota bacterium]|nr:hypothetical protein [Candidatus Cloacimonadota bacterium]HOQ80144.1 hypothetical protein [Candidatus Cloacimonadota bacterium]
MKKIILISIICLFISGILSAQILDDLSNDDFLSKDSIVEVKYQQKSAQKAMLYSALFPGAGQFYVNKKSIMAYVYPIIEISLWSVYISDFSKGDDVTKKYKKFADEHYDRARQTKVQNNFINHPSLANSIYSTNHFRLDDTNTQHFYEDIGKYNKYIFGWEDWYEKYVRDINGNNIECIWVFDGLDTLNPSDIVWIGNRPINPPEGYGANEYDSPDKASEMRKQYIQMRKNAEKHYSSADNMRFLLAANHLVSSIEAFRATNKYNRNALKTVSIQPTIETTVFNNQITPILSINCKF